MKNTINKDNLVCVAKLFDINNKLDITVIQQDYENFIKELNL